MAEHVSTPPEDIVVRSAPGGHLGLFMGSEALREHWPPLMAGVAERSLRRGEPDEALARAVTPAGVPPIPAP